MVIVRKSIRHTASRLRRYLIPASALALCVVVLIAAQHLSKTFDYHTVIKAMCQLPTELLVRAMLATGLSYLALIGRDAVALRYIGAKVPHPLLWLGAFAGSALGNAVGFGALTGGAVRYRVYSAAGISAAQVARLSVLTGATFAFALAILSGLGLVFAASPIGGELGMSSLVLQAIGLALLAGGAALTAWLGPSRIGAGVGTGKPLRGFLCAQLILVGIDVIGAAVALFVLLPVSPSGFGTFLAVYTIALSLGVIGHTPGGLGVFEAIMIFGLGGTVPPAAAAAALLAYRAIYFILPLMLSGALLAAFEVKSVAARLAPRGLQASSPGMAQLVPMFLGVISFAVGVMVLVSGATPAFGGRLAVLATALPLWVVEASQLLGSMFGVILLFAARGLMRRLDAAWWMAMAIAVASLVLSLFKGLAFVEAGVLGFLIILLALTRHRFDRPASLFRERFTVSWLVSIGIVLIAVFWVFFFAFRDVPYSHELWWRFAFDEKASRALRATLGASLFAGALALGQLLRPASGRLSRPSPEDLRLAALIVSGQERSAAVLAMMGDKSFVFSPSHQAFLMYAKRGRSWVALYDPIGPREEWPALIARFVALAHAHGGRAAFYQVRPDALPLYLDAGLKLMKLGEEACIALDAFTLDGSQRANLRYALKRGQREGLSAEIIGPQGVTAVLPILAKVSKDWLDGRQAREKRFSVAAFDAASLATQSVIIVRQGYKAIAFATFMTTGLHTEATVGVMRHITWASPYAMEFLFTKLALHLKEAGFQRLSLGMAPLSGLAPTPLAAIWHRIGHLLWCFGGRLYNFRGLRTFKSKFNPDWQPRYLAASGTLGPFVALADLALLTDNRL